MKTLLFLLALLLPACAAYPPEAEPPFNPQDTTLRLGFGPYVCSGTAVGPHTILTASHCATEFPLTETNDAPVKALKYTHDGLDHVLIRVDREFPQYATVSLQVPPQGTHVRMWGNPGGLRDQYREGYIAGTCPAAECYPLPGIYPDMVTVEINGWKGDSGAALWDGNIVVGVVSVVITSMPSYAPSAVMPMAFTPEQLMEAAR